MIEPVLLTLSNQYCSALRPVVVNSVTSTGQYSPSKIVLFSSEEKLRPLSGSQLFLIQYYTSFLQAQEERKVHLWIKSTPVYGFIDTR